MRNTIGSIVGVIVLAIGWAVAAAMLNTNPTAGLVVGVVTFFLALLLGASIKVANQWDRAVVMRFGKFQGLKGPGIFMIIPIIDVITYWIDVRVILTSFTAEKTLTKDTVPVDVDAVLFWKVVDSKKAALEVVDYRGAISWASQTALRDVIGKTDLADMLAGREKIDAALQQMIELRTEPWGITVQSVEIRDVTIPSNLQDAMSMQAQAERERQARVILGESERQIADSFVAASRMYAKDPTALHLRAMNMVYEGLKTKATLIVVPSSALETMQLGGNLAAMASIARSQGEAPEAVAAQRWPATGHRVRGDGQPLSADIGAQRLCFGCPPAANPHPG